jgi:hypothetical protein
MAKLNGESRSETIGASSVDDDDLLDDIINIVQSQPLSKAPQTAISSSVDVTTKQFVKQQIANAAKQVVS